MSLGFRRRRERPLARADAAQVADRGVVGAVPEAFVRLYELATDVERIVAMQETSLGTRGGLATNPTIGTADWWEELRDGRRPITEVCGVVDSVYWASMADWAEFGVKEIGGGESLWTRLGDPRRYVPGLRVRIVATQHLWKQRDSRLFDTRYDVVVLCVDIEDGTARSSGIAPGPGGFGFDLARKKGDVFHYLAFPNANALKAGVDGLESMSELTLVSADGTEVVVAHRHVSDAERWSSFLEAYAETMGGRYDGGEVVDGDSGVRPRA